MDKSNEVFAPPLNVKVYLKSPKVQKLVEDFVELYGGFEDFMRLPDAPLRFNELSKFLGDNNIDIVVMVQERSN